MSSGLEDALHNINAYAREVGFAQAGIAPVPLREPGQAEYLEQWIAGGRAGEMDWLKRRDEQGRLVRSSLEVALPWARSVIVCAAPYDADAPLSIDPTAETQGWIARYAWSGSRIGPNVAAADPEAPLRPSDYHKVLLRRLHKLEALLRAATPEPFTSRAWVDTGPLIERSYAHAAGIGWTAKNTCTLSETLGSFFFLGVIATSLEVSRRATLPPPDRCGSCTRCLDACPTNALPAPYEMDASRCIAYLTIEKRGAIAEELRAPMGRQIFGCDICQDVCPWNAKHRRDGPIRIDPELEPRPELINPELSALAAMSEEEYAAAFFGSPVRRARYEGLRRNVAIAMGNSGRADFLPQLEAWADDPDAVLAESARWAIDRIMPSEGD
jgi:epoxyqueuosine reductase